MNNYEVIVYFNDESTLKLLVSHENLYSLQTSVSSMGNNGVWEVLDENNRIYHSPYKINKIEVIKK